MLTRKNKAKKPTLPDDRRVPLPELEPIPEPDDEIVVTDDGVIILPEIPIKQG